MRARGHEPAGKTVLPHLHLETSMQELLQQLAVSAAALPHTLGNKYHAAAFCKAAYHWSAALLTAVDSQACTCTLHCPQMGGLHPRASLYEKPVNLEAAKQVRRLPGWLVD